MSADETLVHEVVLLFRQGMSGRAISRALEVGRNTVRDILRSHEVARGAAHNQETKDVAGKNHAKGCED